MSNFGDLYATYYDLLYQDKDYRTEVDYILSLIPESKPKTSLLDMGCGTGKHAEFFCENGLNVHGIDISKDMLDVAESRRKGREENLTFSYGDVSHFSLDRTFDVVVSLFHVMSYQTSNNKLINTLKSAKRHLQPGGLFLFDFWYGPAVLTDLPTTRVKRLENDEIYVTRLAESQMAAQKNTVSVNYDIFIKNKKTSEFFQKQETHHMRYFFDTELEMLCEMLGFKIKNKFAWMQKTEPNFDSWNAIWVLTT